MDILDGSYSLHDLAESGSVEKWAQISGLAQLEEYSHMIKYQLNKRNELRYTPLQTSIFSRLVAQEEHLLNVTPQCLVNFSQYFLSVRNDINSN